MIDLRGLDFVHLPGDPGYDQARTTWALAHDLHPAAVAFPADVAGVVAVIRAATAAGLRIAPIGTGHNVHPFGDLGDTVLIRTSRIADIEIDAAARRARVGAGALWAPVVEAAGHHGLAALHGSSPDAGVVGYLLGGGVGWYGRALGLAVNTVTAVELVLADGTPVRADAEHEPDLFWALRGGGGGNFGVVTAIEFTLFPIADVYAGMLVWDLADAHRVLSRWATWAAAAPDEVTTSYRHLRFPPIPEVPEPFRGRSLVVIDGAVLTGDAEADRILAPLRELEPEWDTFARVPASSLVRLHMDPEEPTPGGGRGILLDDLPPAAIDNLVDASGPDSGSTLFLTEVRQYGGALARTAPGAGALSRLPGSFQVLAGGIMLPDFAKQTWFDVNRVIDSVAPWSSGRQYLNFAEEPVDVSAGFEPEAWPRLQRVRSAVDPDGRFRANHEIPPRR